MGPVPTTCRPQVQRGRMVRRPSGLGFGFPAAAVLRDSAGTDRFVPRAQVAKLDPVPCTQPGTSSRSLPPAVGIRGVDDHLIHPSWAALSREVTAARIGRVLDAVRVRSSLGGDSCRFAGGRVYRVQSHVIPPELPTSIVARYRDPILDPLAPCWSAPQRQGSRGDQNSAMARDAQRPMRARAIDGPVARCGVLASSIRSTCLTLEKQSHSDGPTNRGASSGAPSCSMASSTRWSSA